MTPVANRLVGITTRFPDAGPAVTIGHSAAASLAGAPPREAYLPSPLVPTLVMPALVGLGFYQDDLTRLLRDLADRPRELFEAVIDWMCE